MRLSKCFYCSANVYPGHGISFVRNDARMFTFCRSKCHSHFKARHNPKKSKWTKAHRKFNGKELAVDSIFNFEKRRNAPVKYNRDLYIKTIQAMKLIDRIREKRKLRFYLARMRTAQNRHMPAVQKNVQNNAHVLEASKVASKLLAAKRRAANKPQKIAQQDAVMA